MTSERLAYLLELAAESQSTPVEAALAVAYVKAHAAAAQDFDFQKRVGVGVELGPQYDQATRNMARTATMKRVDVVMYTAAGATLVELKDHIDLAALRQARDYAERWAINPATPQLAGVVVVGRTRDHGSAVSSQQLGVTLELWPDVLPLFPRTAPEAL